MKLEIYDGSLNVEEILSRWYRDSQDSNYGAYIPFVGTVRSEDGISGLSFDLYRPILESWFKEWQKRAWELGADIRMAHSEGDVHLHQTSYISAVFSRKRRVALELIDEFVEDFKANAPIWKYDLIDGKRVYARDRSTPLKNSGILG